MRRLIRSTLQVAVLLWLSLPASLAAQAPADAVLPLRQKFIQNCVFRITAGKVQGSGKVKVKVDDCPSHTWRRHHHSLRLRRPAGASTCGLGVNNWGQRP